MSSNPLLLLPFSMETVGFFLPSFSLSFFSSSFFPFLILFVSATTAREEELQGALGGENTSLRSPVLLLYAYRNDRITAGASTRRDLQLISTSSAVLLLLLLLGLLAFALSARSLKSVVPASHQLYVHPRAAKRKRRRRKRSRPGE